MERIGTRKPLETMEPSPRENGREAPKYIAFPSIEHGALRDGRPVLNRWSSTLTKGHDFPGAQVPVLPMSALRDGLTDVPLGHVVRGGCTEPRDDEEGTARGYLDRVVGGQPLQVSSRLLLCTPDPIRSLTS